VFTRKGKGKALNQKANIKRQKAKGRHFIFCKNRKISSALLPFDICLLPFDLTNA
jgi:hypothetical protein